MPNQPKEEKNSPQKTNAKPMAQKEVKTKTKAKIKASTKIIVGAILAVGVAIGIGVVIFFFGGGEAPPPGNTRQVIFDFHNKIFGHEIDDWAPDNDRQKFDELFPQNQRDISMAYGLTRKSKVIPVSCGPLEACPEGDTEIYGGLVLNNFVFSALPETWGRVALPGIKDQVEAGGGYRQTLTINDQAKCDKLDRIGIGTTSIYINFSSFKDVDIENIEGNWPDEATLRITRPKPDNPKETDRWGHFTLRDKDGNILNPDDYHIRFKILEPSTGFISSAVVYPNGKILPFSPGQTEVIATACEKESGSITISVSESAGEESFLNFNPDGKINFQFLNGVAKSKVIDFDIPNDQAIKEVTIVTHIPPNMRHYNAPAADGVIRLYASNDGGLTWQKSEWQGPYPGGDDTKEEDTEKASFHFTFPYAGRNLQFAVEMKNDVKVKGLENVEPKDVPSGLTDQVPPQVKTKVIGLASLEEPKNESGLLPIYAHVMNAELEGLTTSPFESDFSDESYYTRFWNNKDQPFDITGSYIKKLFGISKREDGSTYPTESSWYQFWPKNTFIKTETEDENLHFFQNNAYTPQSASVQIYDHSKKNALPGFTHVAMAGVGDEWATLKDNMGVITLPLPTLAISKFEVNATLAPESEFAQRPPEAGVQPPEAGVQPTTPTGEISIGGRIPLGQIETPETPLGPSLFITRIPGLIILPPPGDPAICESPTIIYRGHNRVIIKCMPGEAYKNKEMKAFWGEKADLSDKKEAKVYKDKDGKNYFVLRGLKGGEFDDKNDEGYINGRFPYYFKFESEGKSSPIHSFKTLNRWQTIAYYYNLIFTDRLDFQSVDELKNYRGERKSGIEFYYKPRDAEPLTLQGVKFALLNDPGKEFIERLKVTAGITGNKAQIERLYQIIHDRIYDDDLEKYFDPAGVDFWVAQMEQIEEKKRIDLLGAMFGMMTSPEFFNTAVEQAGGDKLRAQAEIAYQIVLQRGADKPGLEYLKTTFKKNKEMREYLVRSEEYDKRLEKIEKDKDLGRKVAIAKLYETIYGRPADVAGVEYWDQYKIKDEKTGKERLATILELKDIFLKSDEFRMKVID